MTMKYAGVLNRWAINPGNVCKVRTPLGKEFFIWVTGIFRVESSKILDTEYLIVGNSINSSSSQSYYQIPLEDVLEVYSLSAELIPEEEEEEEKENIEEEK